MGQIFGNRKTNGGGVLKSNVTQNNESTSICARPGYPLNREVIQHLILVSSNILKISKSVKLDARKVIFDFWKRGIIHLGSITTISISPV